MPDAPDARSGPGGAGPVDEKSPPGMSKASPGQILAALAALLLLVLYLKGALFHMLVMAGLAR